MFWFALFALGAALDILLGWHAWPGIFAGNLTDPDSYMRLQRIRDGIAAGHLVNIVARDDSGAGVLVEWSRLLDMLLWVMAAPLAIVTGWKQALFAAGIALGPLSAGWFAVSLAFTAEPFVARRFLPLIPVAAASLPALANYEAPGIVTHHILLLALIALTAGFTIRAWQGDTGIAFIAGLCGGCAVWLTPETMPFILLCFGALLGRWLESRIGAACAACGAGFFDVLGFGFVIDPPNGGYFVTETDRISLVFACLGLAVLAGGLCLWQIDLRLKTGWRRPAGVAAAAAPLILWLALFPKTLLGPYGLIDASSARLFFGNIIEMQPAKFDVTSFAYLWPGALALCLALAGWLRFRSWRWAYLVCVLALALALGAKFLRFAPISAAAAAVLVTIALQRLSAHFKDRPAAAGIGRIALVALLLLVPRLPAMALAHRAAPAVAGSAPSCDLRHIGALLSGATGKIVLADVNDTPELLWRSQVETVGSLYHHGVAGFLRLRAAWRAQPGAAAPPAVLATGANLILVCPGNGRTDLVADLPKTTLWDAMDANHPPPWVALIGKDPAGWQLYTIRH